jgi:threonine dehydrogenase-like Zn-dependent dehydrogenase
MEAGSDDIIANWLSPTLAFGSERAKTPPRGERLLARFARREQDFPVKAVNHRREKAEANALWYVAPGVAELRRATLPLPGADEVLVRTLFSGLSRGTERLVFEGRVPESEWQRMKVPSQEGEFSFPVKYGYAAVGVVEMGPDALCDRTVFALHPHQDRFVVAADKVAPIPEGVPAQRAVLAANLETALNILWDGNAERRKKIIVIGGGLVGLLTVALAAPMTDTEVTLIDVNPARAEFAAKFGADFALPADAPSDADLVIHTTATEEGLALALASAGDEATVVEASWYGNKKISLGLGGAFHARRLSLVSSQVGGLSPARRRAGWTNERRLKAAIHLLADDRLDALLGEEIAFAELPRHLPRLLKSDARGVGAYVRY